MKIVRLRTATGQILHGALQPDGSILRLEGDPLNQPTLTGELISGQWLAPVSPSSIFCTGLNYRRHAEETGGKIPEFPVLFMKGVNAVADPGQPIEIPVHLASERVDYECELAIVIGRAAKNVRRSEALDYVAGYTCANDVSARDWQIHHGGSQWCRGKTFDTFCPLGPFLVTPDEIPNPNELRISTTLNDRVVQDWTTGDMIFDVPSLIEFYSGSTTLLPGTVILTGTPHGVGMARDPRLWLQDGDTVTVEIERIGQLTNPVILEPATRPL